MSIFTDEYGDLYGWRVAAAATASLALSVTLAWSLVARRPPTPWPDGRETTAEGQAATQAATDAGTADAVPGTTRAAEDEAATAPAEETPPQAHATVVSGELLGSLTTPSRAELAQALDDWLLAEHGTAEATLTVLAPPEASATDTRVPVRVEAAGATTWAEATIEPGGAWRVEARPEGLEQDPLSPIPLANAALLAQVTGEPVASEVSRQLLASGLEGAQAAWTCAAGVERDGQVTTMAVWLPREGADAERWRATYDTGFGVLELVPDAEGEL